jgi:1A family penicillin-binding protein
MSPRARHRSATPFRRVLWWSVRACGLGLAALLLTLGYFWFSTGLPAPEHLRARAALGSTRILDRHGRLLFEAPDPFAGRRRTLPLQEIPLALRQATIAVEDRDFYANLGVDLRGIVRAAWTDLRSGAAVAGGSTITQQLARSFLIDPTLAQRRTLERKLREAVLALKLTASYPKDEILALYLNQTYYGGMAYGVESASQRFFGKPARELDLAECALLAGLPQAPSRYDPLASPEAARARQAEVLDAMAHAGYISGEQATAAKTEPLQFAPDDGAPRAPHFVRYVLDQLDERLGPDAVARDGLTVTTTLDADLNDTAQASLRRQLELLSTPRNGGPDHRARNGAVVVLDPTSGAILAMVGSPDFEDAAIQGQVNAALAWRQPGSAIKPLTYAAALERGWTAATTILDVPSSFATREGRPYTPQNYDRAYHGPLALREALATSSNVAAVRVLDSIGVPALLDIAARLGIASLSRDSGRYGLSLTLGGGEVTPLELTAAYAAFANGGRRVTPYAIIEIRDWRAGIVRPAGDVQSSISNLQSLSPQIAYLITDILSDRYARMRAFGESSALDIDRPAAAKTGTTSDWRDNWTIGYTPDRAVGVWVGNADGQPMEAISGVSGAGPVWHEVMLAAHRGLSPRPFARPDGIVEVAICAEGGLLPAPDCPATRLERFVEGTQPTRRDDTHVRVAVDAALGCRAPAGYPAEHTVARVFRILPPGAETWAVATGLPQVPRQVCSPLATTDHRPPTTDQSIPSSGVGHQSPALPLDQLGKRGAEGPVVGPTLLSPARGAVFAISPGIPRERQQIAIVAQAGGDAAKLTIYLDGQPIAALAGPPYRAFWALAPGSHRAWAEAQDEHGRIRRSVEVEFVVAQQP